MLLLEEMRYCGHNIPVACCVYLLKNIHVVFLVRTAYTTKQTHHKIKKTFAKILAGKTNNYFCEIKYSTDLVQNTTVTYF